MLANNFSTSTCFAIFELIKFVLWLNTDLNAQRITQPAPAPQMRTRNLRGLTRPAQDFTGHGDPQLQIRIL